MLYVGSDSILPIIPWDEKSPKFYVSSADSDIEQARKQFTKKFLYYLGSHEGCSCGFTYSDSYEKADKSKRIDSLQRLKGYLKDAIVLNGSIELFACWSGEEMLPSNIKMEISLSEFKSETLDVVDGSVIGKNLFLVIEKL
jgi:hypothetical protein